MEYKIIRDRINELHFKYQQSQCDPKNYPCLSRSEWDELGKLYRRRKQLPEYTFELSKVEIYSEFSESMLQFGN